jgi:hypothetical protein
MKDDLNVMICILVAFSVVMLTVLCATFRVEARLDRMEQIILGQTK